MNEKTSTLKRSLTAAAAAIICLSALTAVLPTRAYADDSSKHGKIIIVVGPTTKTPTK